jgi:anti-sigma regulatory factor (Ser/Thr protein kinase)
MTETGLIETAPADAGTVTVDLDSTNQAVVRRRLRGMLDGAGAPETVADAVLVADELISNACLHGRPHRLCRLSLDPSRARLRIAVEDGASDPPTPRQPEVSGGRGLLLVDRLAAAWGVTPGPVTKIVWAEIALDPLDKPRPATQLR